MNELPFKLESKWLKVIGVPIVFIVIMVNVFLLVNFMNKVEAGSVTDQDKWIFSIAYVLCMLGIYHVGSGFITNYYHRRMNELYPFVMKEPSILTLEDGRVFIDYSKLEEMGLQPQRYQTLRQKDLKALRKLVHENRVA